MLRDCDADTGFMHESFTRQSGQFTKLVRLGQHPLRRIDCGLDAKGKMNLVIVSDENDTLLRLSHWRCALLGVQLK